MNVQVAIELCIILCNLISIHSNNKTAKCNYQIYGNMYTKMTPFLMKIFRSHGIWVIVHSNMFGEQCNTSSYQSADNITFHGRTKWLMTDSNKFVPSWRNTCHIIIGCALLFTYVVIHALHKHYGPKDTGWSNRNRSHMYNFLQGLGNIYTILLLYFVIYIDITLKTHPLFWGNVDLHEDIQ